MGGEAKMTVMVLKVDLGCTKCYRKIKRVLCGIPQIRDQLFDEKSNTVTITVICCTPEKVADKICSKGKGTIKGLDIKPSQPPKPAAPPPPQQKEGPPPQAAEKPKQAAPPPAEKPKTAPPQQAEKPKVSAEPKPQKEGGGNGGGGDGDGGKAIPPPQAAPGNGGAGDKPKKVDFAPQPQQIMPPQPQGPPPQQMKPNEPAAFMSSETIPVAGYPSIFPPVVYYDGGPYYQNQGMSAMPPPQRFSQQPVYQYDGYYGRPVADSYRGGGYRGDYYSEENPSSCSVM